MNYTQTFEVRHRCNNKEQAEAVKAFLERHDIKNNYIVSVVK